MMSYSLAPTQHDGLHLPHTFDAAVRPAHFLFRIYIAIVLILPTGNLLGVNVKYVAFITLLLIALHFMFKRGASYLELTFFFTVPLALCVGMIIAVLYGFDDVKLSILQYSFIATTIVGCWLISVYVPKTDSGRLAFVRVVVLSMVSVALVKAAILVYSLRTGVSVLEVVTAISKFFHITLMGYEVQSIGGRIEFISDTVIPVCIFALLFLGKRLGLGALPPVVLAALLTFSSIMSFSRFFWFQTAIAIALGLTGVYKNKFNLLFIATLCALGFYYFDAIALLVDERLSAVVLGNSDLDRISQIIALKEFALDAPFWGHGLGTHTTQSIRDPDTRFGYEVQGLALVGQIGIVGVAILFGLLCSYCRTVFSMERGRVWYRLCLIVLLTSAIAGGFFNPFLLNSTASMNYGLIAVMANVAFE